VNGRRYHAKKAALAAFFVSAEAPARKLPGFSDVRVWCARHSAARVGKKFFGDLSPHAGLNKSD